MRISRVPTPVVGVLALTATSMLSSPALAAEPDTGTVDQRTGFAWQA